MKGLIVKDLLLIKENIKQLVLFVLVFVFIGLQGNQILVFVPAFLSMMMFLSTFSYDDYNKSVSYTHLDVYKRQISLLTEYGFISESE